MGQILSNPVVEKELRGDSDEFSAYGLCTMQGWRMSMEDAHVSQLDVGTDGTDHVAYYSIFDGHGGSSIAEYCGAKSANFVRSAKSFADGDLPQSLIEAFLALDQQLASMASLENDHSGSTATSVLISKRQGKIVCANAGDSRTVLSTNGYAKALSFDHKPTLPSEKSRIVAANGFVEMGRVNGNLALSRAIGDFEFKSNKNLLPHEQIVTSVPDIMTHCIDYNNDEFIVLACDGVWDCLSSQECIDLVHHGIQQKMNLQDIASKIIDVCCAPSTEGSGIGCDNMSIIIVALLQGEESCSDWLARMQNKSSSSKTSFAKKRKQVFNDFEFAKDDEEHIFQITSKQDSSSSSSNKAAQHNRHHLRHSRMSLENITNNKNAHLSQAQDEDLAYVHGPNLPNVVNSVEDSSS